MVDQRIDRAGGVAPMLRRVDWRRVLVGFGIYAAMMAVFGILTVFILVWTMLTYGHEIENMHSRMDHIYIRAFYAYVALSLCVAFWGSGRIVSRQRK
jgi:hypothetical protein